MATIRTDWGTLYWAVGDGYTTWNNTDAVSGWGDISGPLLVAPNKTDIQRVCLKSQHTTAKYDSYYGYKLTIGESFDLPATLAEKSSYLMFTFNEDTKTALCNWLKTTKSRSEQALEIILWGATNSKKTSWEGLTTFTSTIKAVNTNSKINNLSYNMQKTWTATNKTDPTRNTSWNAMITQYHTLLCSWTIAADWMVSEVKLTPSRDWTTEKEVTFTTDIADVTSKTTTTSAATTVTNYYVIKGAFSQPAYPDTYVGSSSKADTTGKMITLAMTATMGLDSSVQQEYNSMLFKYTLLTVNSYDFYRSTADGTKTSEGDYLALQFNLDYNPMRPLYYSTTSSSSTVIINSDTPLNPLTLTIDIKKLLTSEQVFNQTYTFNTLNDKKPSAMTKDDWKAFKWISKDILDLEEGTSYLVTATIADEMYSRSYAVNIGSKPAFIEWSPTGVNMAIGKYIETEDLEIQWDTVFNKSCIFLGGNGVTQLGNAAAAIPYKDTYSIGVSTVQGAINWILGRLS